MRDKLKDPQWIIAINSTIFIAGCLFFGSVAVIGIVSELFDEDNPVRTEHIKQHTDDHVKYDKMIELLEDVNEKLALAEKK